MEATKYCAFNKSRETFVTLDAGILDAAVDPLRVLKVLIEGLGPEARTGLWLTNFKAIPVAQTLSPFDLIYLDEDHRVVHAVELTTDGAFEPFPGEPSSAFVLPPSTISSTLTQTGDQLIVVATPQTKPEPAADSPDAIPAAAKPAAAARPQPKSLFTTPNVDAEPSTASVERDSVTLDRFFKAQSDVTSRPAPLPQTPAPTIEPLAERQIAGLANPASNSPAAITAGEQLEFAEVEAKAEPALPPPTPAPLRPAMAPLDISKPPILSTPVEHSFKSRMREWLFPQPTSGRPRRARDRRRAHRLPMPDLVAYFWTGGAPQPHRLADISITGFYMFTDDLWMPGTVMRMTLQKMGTHGEDPGDSITVHSKVVRHGADGGGFEFVLSGFLDRNLPNSPRSR